MKIRFLLPTLLCLLAQPAAQAYVDRYEEELDLSGNGIPAASRIIERNTAFWDGMILGEVRDSLNRPAPRVGIVLQGKEYVTDDSGRFNVEVIGQSSENLIVKKPGYRKISIAPQSSYITVQLEPVQINSLYMQAGHLKRKTPVFKSAMELVQNTEINALTIDYKDDDGRITVDLKSHIAELHAQGVYTIARVVTFKDNLAARKFPAMALTDATTGKPWEDKKKITYLNPYNPRAWDYVIGIAKKAAEDGFDEIQFDYVRFPTDGNRSLIAWSTQQEGNPKVEFNSQTRSAAIAGFLKLARAELGSMGAFVAADVFGITAYDKNDSGIGQQIEAVAPYLDYICPMLYPSGFGAGTEGLKNPVDHPGAILEGSVRRYRVRAEKVNSDVVIRPWLQSFRDYAFNHRLYTGTDVRDQIDGSDRAGGSGYLLWNAASKYEDTKSGLKPKNRSRRIL